MAPLPSILELKFVLCNSKNKNYSCFAFHTIVKILSKVFEFHSKKYE